MQYQFPSIEEQLLNKISGKIHNFGELYRINYGKFLVELVNHKYIDKDDSGATVMKSFIVSYGSLWPEILCSEGMRIILDHRKRIIGLSVQF